MIVIFKDYKTACWFKLCKSADKPKLKSNSASDLRLFSYTADALLFRDTGLNEYGKRIR